MGFRKFGTGEVTGTEETPADVDQSDDGSLEYGERRDPRTGAIVPLTVENRDDSSDR